LVKFGANLYFLLIPFIFTFGAFNFFFHLLALLFSFFIVVRMIITIWSCLRGGNYREFKTFPLIRRARAHLESQNSLGQLDKRSS